MIRIRVVSSVLKSIGYDEAHQILEAEFISGEVYQYFEVPIEIYHELMDADSIGTYLNNIIKTCYDFRHIE